MHFAAKSELHNQHLKKNWYLIAIEGRHVCTVSPGKIAMFPKYTPPTYKDPPSLRVKFALSTDWVPSTPDRGVIIHVTQPTAPDQGVVVRLGAKNSRIFKSHLQLPTRGCSVDRGGGKYYWG